MINKSHFLGAVVGMERLMGRTDTSVRRVLNYAHAHHLKTTRHPVCHERHGCGYHWRACDAWTLRRR